MGRSTRSGSDVRAKTRAVLVRLEEPLEAALREHAASQGLSAAGLVRFLIETEVAGGQAAKARNWKPSVKRVKPDNAADIRALWIALARATGALIMTAQALRTRHSAPELYRETEVQLGMFKSLLAPIEREVERLAP